jgi:hypothetical protein
MGISATNAMKIRITLEITDPETVEVYRTIDPNLLFEDLPGMIPFLVNLVSAEVIHDLPKSPELGNSQPTTP